MINTVKIGMLHEVLSAYGYHYFQGLTSADGDFEASWSTGHDGRGERITVRVPADGLACYVNERAIPSGYTLRDYLKKLLTPVLKSPGTYAHTPYAWEASPAAGLPSWDGIAPIDLAPVYRPIGMDAPEIPTLDCFGYVSLDLPPDQD